MSQSSPPGRTVNRTELATLCGVGLPTVDAWVRRGCPFVVRGGKGKEWHFDSKEVIAWLRQQDVEEALGSTENTDLDEAKLRKARAEARMAELELDRQRGESISRDSFHRFMTSAFSRCRAKLLAIPNRLGSRVSPDVRGPIIEATRAEIHDALNELANTTVTADPGEPV